MTRRISGAIVDGEARSSGQRSIADTLELDERVRDVLAERVQKAHEQGLDEGRRQGSLDAVSRADELIRSIGAGIDDLKREVAGAELATITSLVELAFAIADTVIDYSGTDEGKAAAGRIRSALERLDDPPFVVSVHPDDEAVIRGSLAGYPDVQILAEPTLGPGEASVRGGWSVADLTRPAVLDAVREALTT